MPLIIIGFIVVWALAGPLAAIAGLVLLCLIGAWMESL